MNSLYYLLEGSNKTFFEVNKHILLMHIPIYVFTNRSLVILTVKIKIFDIKGK